MTSNRSLMACGQRTQRAALRERLLDYGRALGWSAHTTITFTEGLMRRPWKHGTVALLSSVADELHTIVLAFEVRRTTSPTLFEAAGMRTERGAGHAARY